MGKGQTGMAIPTKEITRFLKICENEDRPFSNMIKLLIWESFGTPEQQTIANRVLTPLREKYDNSQRRK